MSIVNHIPNFSTLDWTIKNNPFEYIPDLKSLFELDNSEFTSFYDSILYYFNNLEDLVFEFRYNEFIQFMNKAYFEYSIVPGDNYLIQYYFDSNKDITETIKHSEENPKTFTLKLKKDIFDLSPLKPNSVLIKYTLDTKKANNRELKFICLKELLLLYIRLYTLFGFLKQDDQVAKLKANFKLDF